MDFRPSLQTLPQGMRLITLSMPQSQSVTALLMVKVGSRYEEREQAGISHFLEHMVFKGTEKYPTAFAISSTVDSIGAECNAFTSKEYTGFYVKSESSHLDLCLNVLSQLVFQPLLPEKELEKEKGVICEEINMIHDVPMAKVERDFEILLYGKTCLGRPTIGFKRTIGNLGRQNFLEYCQQWYQPERMILGIVGDLKALTKININKHFFPSDFDLLKPRKVKALKTLKKLDFSQQKPELKVYFKQTEQTHFCLGVRALPQAHPDRYVMAVLTTILGGNMSSRLFTEVREKRGLAYYIRSSVDTFFDNGYLVVQAGVDINKVYEAIRVVLAEFGKILSGSKEVKSQELKKAKEYLKGRLALSLEDSKDIAGLFVEDLLLEDKIRTPDEIIKGVEKVSLADIKRIGKKIFVNQGLNLCVIGPHKEEAKFAKILKM